MFKLKDQPLIGEGHKAIQDEDSWENGQAKVVNGSSGAKMAMSPVPIDSSEHEEMQGSGLVNGESGKHQMVQPIRWRRRLIPGCMGMN
jgi:hypothetical protein